MSRIGFRLPITDSESLYEFVRIAFGVTIPRTRVCPDHSTPWDAFEEAFFALSPVSVWVASRGFGGKSFLLALLGLTEAILLKADISLLGGSGEQSRRIHEYMGRFLSYPNAPRHLLGDSSSQWKTEFQWGNRIQALTASQRSVRGLHPQRLRLDEVDEMELEIFNASLGQTMSRNSIKAQTVISSTVQNPDGTMMDVLRRAKEKNYPVHKWCWRETSNPIDGWLPIEEVERKKLEIPDYMWEMEYELHDPAPTNRIFHDTLLEEIFCLGADWQSGLPFEYIEIEPPKPEGIYVTSADWAKKKDWSILVCLRIDCDPWRVVAFERRGREPWQLVIERLDFLNHRYRTNLSVHDGTGIGDVINDYLKTHSDPIIFTQKVKQELVTDLVARVQNKQILLPKIEYLYNEFRFVTTESVYGSDHLPDCISALGMAVNRAKFGDRIGIFF